MTEMSSEFRKVDSKFANIDAKLDKMQAEFHRLAILMEEQNSRNKFVLDGYALLHDKIERLEK